MPIVKMEEWTGEPVTKAYVFFGRKRPKNLEENLAAQKDSTMQSMIWEWCREKDPKLKDKMWQKAKKYWAKRRVELGFTGSEE